MLPLTSGGDFSSSCNCTSPSKNPFQCIFTRNTVKLSYSCNTNIDNIAKAHNTKTLSKDEATGAAKNSSCGDGTTFPVANKCLTTNVVYKATVKYEDKTRHYVGMTENFLPNPVHVTQIFDKAQ